MGTLTLFMSLRSPFARRIRLLLEEMGVRYRTEVIDVFNPPIHFLEINPLGRIPAMALENGEVMIDSTEIFQYLKERHLSHSLFNTQGSSPVRLHRLTGLTLGVMEYTVQAFLETLRPSALQIEDVRNDFLVSIRRALQVLESELRGPYLLGDALSVHDLDLGAALAYSDLRLGAAFVNQYPKLRQYLILLQTRESFIKTVPPA